MVVALALAGCTATKPSMPVIEHLPWRTVVLPKSPSGRDVVRAVTACNGHWYIAGGILHPDGTTAPALWTSQDGANFAAMRIVTISFYGPLDALSTVTCHGGDVVAIGASSGGAHGNLRTSTWLSTAGGPLTEMPSGFELFGGGNEIGVGTVTAGPPGFLIVGARVDRSGGVGAAVWTSPDGTAFTLHDGDPALESDARGATEVYAAAPVAGGFVAVGAITPPHSPLAARDPIAWTSPDGSAWQRHALPHTTVDDSLLDVAQLAGNVLAIGTDGTQFTVWTADPTAAGWHVTARFGALARTTTIPLASSLVVTGSDTAYTVVSTSASYELWHGGIGGTWQQVALPETVSAAPVRSGPRVVAAAANGTELMVAADDGTAAHLWFASVS
jgi:hypothetical protein